VSIPVPLEPDLIILTDAQLELLKRCRGGYETVNDTPEGEAYARFEELGLVKSVTFGDTSTHWRLSGHGCTLAYSDLF